MIKCGFYIENDGLKSVDCTDLRKGNPGIGGVEYATLLVAEWLSLTKDDISLTLYVRSSQNLPPSIHVNVCSDVMEALVKSVNNGDEIFVLRFEPLYLQRHLLDNSFLHKLKIVLWAHNFYSRRYLSCHLAASHHDKSGRAYTPSHNRHEHHTSARRFS